MTVTTMIETKMPCLICETPNGPDAMICDSCGAPMALISPTPFAPSALRSVGISTRAQQTYIRNVTL